MNNKLLKRIISVVLMVIGVYLVLRALVEPFLISYGQPESYKHDWGGPTYVGVLMVHMVPGAISLILLTISLRKKNSKLIVT